MPDKKDDDRGEEIMNDERKKNDDSGLIDVRTVDLSGDDEVKFSFDDSEKGKKAEQDFCVMVRMSKGPSSLRFYVVVASIAVLVVVAVVFAVVFLKKTDNQDRSTVAPIEAFVKEIPGGRARVEFVRSVEGDLVEKQIFICEPEGVKYEKR